MGDKGQLVLPGATKETLRAMPQFEYHRKLASVKSLGGAARALRFEGP
jgi:hypothetical protein